MKKFMNRLGNIFCGAGVIMCVWVIASYIEVISKNLGENPSYTFWNFFQLIINLYEAINL